MTNISWTTYFMSIAQLAKVRSPDSSKNGCVLVDEKNRVVSLGYNGPVSGLHDKNIPTERPAKYRWMIHAEINALLFSQRKATQAFITSEPCSQCFLALAQSGVKRIVYDPTNPSALIQEEDRMARRSMAFNLGIAIEGFNP